MGTARRLYLYIVSAVSLFALAGGLVILLRAVFGEVEGSDSLTGGGMTREQLSLAIALMAVGGPTWLLHWWLARRGLRASGLQGDADRASALRAWYLALVQAVALGTGLGALIGLGEAVLARLLGVAHPPTWTDSLATALVAVPVWAACARSRAAEIRMTRMNEAAAWLTRLYRYGALYATLLVMLAGAAGLIATILSVLVNRPELGLDEGWWRTVAAGQAAAIVVGFGAWLLHWRDSAAVIRDAAAIGEDDRETRLRAAYFGGVLVTTAAWSAFAVASAVGDLGRWMLGINSGDLTAFLDQVVGPPLAVLPLIAAAWWHARYAVAEASCTGDAATTAAPVAAAKRNARLLLALVGLGFLAAGAVQLLQAGIEQLASTAEPSMLGDPGARRAMPWYLAQLVVGAALWLPSWLAVLAARGRRLADERATSASRAHLFLVVGVAIVATVPTATAILYQALNTLLGGQGSRPLLAELSFPIAAVAVAVAIGAYHARFLLGDIRAGGVVPGRRAEVAGEIAGRAVSASTGEVAAQAAGETVIGLVLHAPAGVDAEAVIADLRERIPAGSTLEVVGDGPQVAPAPV